MSVEEPPTPPSYPVVGKTLDFARDPLGLGAELKDRYGPVHRLSVLGIGEFVNITHATGAEQVLVNKQGAFRKTEAFRSQLGESLIGSDGEQWKRQRSALERFFTPSRISTFGDQMVSLTERRIEDWADGDTVSLLETMRGLTLDHVFATFYDRTLELHGEKSLRRAAADVKLWAEPTVRGLPNWIPTPSRRRYQAALTTLREEGRKLLENRRESHARGETGEDLLSTLVTLQADGPITISDDEIVDQLIGLSFGVHENVAILLTCALHHLGTNDDVRRRFENELSSVLGDSTPDPGDVEALDVTRRIIRETLRAYPPAYLISRETVEPVTIDGYRIVAGERIHVDLWQVHHDSDDWSEPEVWRPSRWQDITPDEAGYSYIPFGAGQTKCIGQRFAELEATLVLATLGQQYRLDPTSSLEFDPLAFLTPDGDVPVTVRQR